MFKENVVYIRSTLCHQSQSWDKTYKSINADFVSYAKVKTINGHNSVMQSQVLLQSRMSLFWKMLEICSRIVSYGTLSLSPRI